MGLEFSASTKAEIETLTSKYPEKSASLLPVLHLAQQEFGHLSLDAQRLVARTLDLPPARVHEVVTFYEMYHEHPHGQFHLEVCTNISCHLAGADGIVEHLQKSLGISVGHQTEDGMFSLMEVECLASCGSGPMIRVGEDYYEGLSCEAADELLVQLRAEAPRLEGKAYECSRHGPHVGPLRGFEPPKLSAASSAGAALAEDLKPPSDAPAPAVSLPSFEAPRSPREESSAAEGGEAPNPQVTDE